MGYKKTNFPPATSQSESVKRPYKVESTSIQQSVNRTLKRHANSGYHRCKCVRPRYDGDVRPEYADWLKTRDYWLHPDFVTEKDAKRNAKGMSVGAYMDSVRHHSRKTYYTDFQPGHFLNSEWWPIMGEIREHQLQFRWVQAIFGFHPLTQTPAFAEAYYLAFVEYPTLFNPEIWDVGASAFILGRHPFFDNGRWSVSAKHVYNTCYALHAFINDPCASVLVFERMIKKRERAFNGDVASGDGIYPGQGSPTELHLYSFADSMEPSDGSQAKCILPRRSVGWYAPQDITHPQFLLPDLHEPTPSDYRTTFENDKGVYSTFESYTTVHGDPNASAGYGWFCNRHALDAIIAYFESKGTERSSFGCYRDRTNISGVRDKKHPLSVGITTIKDSRLPEGVNLPESAESRSKLRLKKLLGVLIEGYMADYCRARECEMDWTFWRGRLDIGIHGYPSDLDPTLNNEFCIVLSGTCCESDEDLGYYPDGNGNRSLKRIRKGSLHLHEVRMIDAIHMKESGVIESIFVHRNAAHKLSVLRSYKVGSGSLKPHPDIFFTPQIPVTYCP